MTAPAPSTLSNFRDLGGLPTDGARRTRPGVLYRSDAPLPGDQAPDATTWPPAVVVDLRSADEPIEPHPLRSTTTPVHRFPLLGEARPRTLRELREGGRLSFDGLYPEIAERAGRIVGTVLDLLTTADGPVLVHCAAGKDRTGVLVALLLRAAGVTRHAVVSDYVRTAPAMGEVRRRMTATDFEVAALIAEFPEAVAAPAAAIEAVLDLVDTRGGITPWLGQHGVQGAVIEAWQARMVGDLETEPPSQ